MRRDFGDGTQQSGASNNRNSMILHERAVFVSQAALSRAFTPGKN
jgi:hypothetical protein